MLADDLEAQVLAMLSLVNLDFVTYKPVCLVLGSNEEGLLDERCCSCDRCRHGP